jgi:hypothetical protein
MLSLPSESAALPRLASIFHDEINLPLTLADTTLDRQPGAFKEDR